MALALFSMPETHEQWATWGAVERQRLHGRIERLGLNLGAPGDRRTRDGTLWLDFPSVGGPSPDIEVVTEPAQPETFYQHSLWMQGGQGWPWVASSGLKGLKRLSVHGLKNTTYTLRLTFSAPDTTPRRFSIDIQGKAVLSDIAPKAHLAQTETLTAIPVTDGTLRLQFTAEQGDPLLCGLEILRDGLKPGELPKK
jgi:hypothetical protein